MSFWLYDASYPTSVSDQKIETKKNNRKLPTKDEKFISKLQHRYLKALTENLQKITDEKDTDVNNLIHMESIREMALKLPQNEDQMLQIPHITNAIFESIGKILLDVVLPYNRTTEDSDDSDIDWSFLGSGFKRKINDRADDAKSVKKIKI